MASHMVTSGLVDEDTQLTDVCRRRYDRRLRNPFSEYEASHWYARALSSYALLRVFSGMR